MTVEQNILLLGDKNMTPEAIISIISAALSLAATIIIAIVQYKQGKRMEKLANRQDEEETRRRKQQIMTQRNAFIMKYHNDNYEIYLLPLCWTASVYNPALAYHRKMYMEYNMLEVDVQKAICDYMGFNVETSLYGEDFYCECVKKLEQKEQEYNSHEAQTLHIFYDNAKYLENCIKYLKHEPLPEDIDLLEREIKEFIIKHLENNTEYKRAVEKFALKNRFYGYNDKTACKVCAVAAKGIAEYNSDLSLVKSYWIPGSYGGEQLETFEDLFLCVLFCIYVNLIIPDSKENNTNKKM